MLHDLILIIDFGSQYTQLIARRIRELNVYCEIVPFYYDLEKILSRKPKGIIFSGGPNSVYDEQAPKVSAEFYSKIKVPILGICYGMQLI
ncbi:MAG: GMP synthase (glutamine-hydrolyzing), partial [Acidobacteria bacterium]